VDGNDRHDGARAPWSSVPVARATGARCGVALAYVPAPKVKLLNSPKTMFSARASRCVIKCS